MPIQSKAYGLPSERLVLTGDPAKLAAVTEEIKLSASVRGGSNEVVGIEAVDLDVTAGEQSVDAAVHKAWLVFGHIDVLLNCANYSGSLKSSLETSEGEWMKIFNVNLNGAWLVTKAVTKRMRDSSIGGSIIFVTSIVGTERGLPPGASAYATSMAAVNHLTKTLALDFGKYNIRVNAIARGLSDSDSLYRSMITDTNGKPEKEALPLGRWADVSKDFSSTIVYLAGDSSAFLTGTIIVIDGGQSLVRARMRSYI
ncbi:hypothetical protein O6H91_04G020900 [Diphasiastrum complanatum]|uniref:Uncharacterized protein n=1 Tax=Diphasiastrum complanatum TaxID=34168 RepID=A0ACC2DV32_DIPCM|nr:hypothetical protein O6H91_04G020900 [Diphasiastrum complanatum]